MINIFFAILPGIIFFLLSFYFDKDFIVKRWKVLIIVFILGAIGSYICYRLEMHYGSFFKKVISESTPSIDKTKHYISK